MRTRLLAAILLGCLSCSAGAQISSSDTTAPSVASREPQIIPTQMQLTRGMPQNPHIVKSLPGLNDQALEAVRRYRFHPAMKGGKIPVPVMVTIEVNFRLY